MIRDLFEEKPYLKKIILFVLAGIVVIIIIIIIFSVIFGGKIEYGELETKIQEAAITYYDTNKESLPCEGNSVVLQYNTLEEAKLLKSLDKYLGDNNCSANVTVKNNGGFYNYSTKLDCGNDYQTKEIYTKILSDNKEVTSGDGLYLQNDGSKVFRGEKINNYLEFDSKIWRIIKIDNDNSIKIMLNEGFVTTSYDNRYNTSQNSNYGKNDYMISRLKEALESLQNDDEFITKNNRFNLVPKSYCIDKKSEKDDLKTNFGNCTNFIENQLVGALTADEFVYTSLDSNCLSISNKECQNYNYLTGRENSWWTLTANKDNTYQAFYVSSYGSVETANCSTEIKANPVVYLSGSSIYKEGSGTFDDPYVIK